MMHVTDTWLRDRAGVHRSTVARWRVTRKYPPAIERLAELELMGRLELIHDAWAGWRVDARTGELIAPGGERYRAGELAALPIKFQLVTELERRAAELERQRPTLLKAVLELVKRCLGGERRPPAKSAMPGSGPRRDRAA